MPSIPHDARIPILSLAPRLPIHPQQSPRHQIVERGPAPRRLPPEIVPQHADADPAEDLGRLDDGGLVGAELARDAADVLPAADDDDGVAAEGLERLDGAAHVVVADGVRALHAAAGDALAEVGQGDEAAVFGARGAADFDDADGELEVEVVDGAA